MCSSRLLWYIYDILTSLNIFSTTFINVWYVHLYIYQNKTNAVGRKSNESNCMGMSVFALPPNGSLLLQNPGTAARIHQCTVSVCFLYAVPYSWRSEQCGIIPNHTIPKLVYYMDPLIIRESSSAMKITGLS